MKEIYKNSGQNNGYGILIIPDNYQETMTFEQKEACLRLINTNKSLFGNYEKIELSINKISSEEKLDKEEFTKYLIEKEVLKSLR